MCDAACSKIYNVSTAQSGKGAACEAEPGATGECEPGEGDCPIPCSSMPEFQAVLDPVNKECCDEPAEDCSSGYPARCNDDCAAVLLPVQAACADFLHGAGLKPVKKAIATAAAQCPVRVRA